MTWRLVDASDNPVATLHGADIFRLIRHLRALNPAADRRFYVIDESDQRHALREVIR